LVSVCSDAHVSMLGMMEAILNLGLNNVKVRGQRSKAIISVLHGIPVADSSICLENSP
jgi:hypothetical protein